LDGERVARVLEDERDWASVLIDLVVEYLPVSLLPPGARRRGKDGVDGSVDAACGVQDAAQPGQGAFGDIAEHDMDLVAGADHVLNLGPGGGNSGGRIVATGTPVEVAGRCCQPEPPATCEQY
jgi:hypothetical protein